MFRAFLFLIGTTFRNRLFQRIRRLRHPRYLIGLAFGLFYVWAFFLRPYAAVAPPHGAGVPPHGGLAIRIVSLGLLIFVARWWLFEQQSPVLAFAPAEVQYLFPAPLRRRDLLSYKLLTAQIQLLFSAIVISLFAQRLNPTMPPGLRAIAAWVFLVTLYLHHLGAALVRVGVTQSSPARKRPFLAVAIAAIAALALVIGIIVAWPAHAGPGLGGVLFAISVTLRSPVVGAVLWPFRKALGPLFASSPAGWAHALLFAVPLLVVHYVWVLRIDVRFEEAAADASVALAGRIRAMRQRMMGGPAIATGPSQEGRRQRAWFGLRSTGEPSIAIVWKNMIALQRRGWRAIWTSALLIAVFVSIFASGRHSMSGSPALALAAGLGALAWMLAFFRPVAFQNDIRRDVGYLALLRTYPLSGVRIMVASIASTVLPLAAAQLILVAAACVICPWDLNGQVIGIGPRVAVFVISAIALPALDTTSATISNAVTLLFPGARGLASPIGGAGAEGIGQIIVSRIASVIGVVLSFVAPTGVAVLANWLGRQFLAPPHAMLGAIAAFVLAYAAQLSLMMRTAGRVFERTDAVAVSAVD